MNLEELLRDTKPRYIPVDKVVMAKNVFQALSEEPSVRGKRLRGKHLTKVRVAAAAGVLLAGGALATGFASPAMTNFPVIGRVFNLLGNSSFAPSGMQDAVKQGLSQEIHQTVTDQGITISVGNIYCEQDFFQLDMVESFMHDAKSRPVIRQSDMGLNIGGNRPVLNISGGEFIPTRNTNGYAGTVYFSEFGGEVSYLPLPESFNLYVHIDHIGAVKGHWDFVIPVSRTKTMLASKIYTPMKSVTANGRTLTVQKITIAPVQTTINYELRQPANHTPIDLVTPYTDDIAAFGDGGKRLSGSANVVSVHREGNTDVVEMVGLYESPRPTPAYLVLKPDSGTGHGDATSTLPAVRIDIP